MDILYNFNIAYLILNFSSSNTSFLGSYGGSKLSKNPNFYSYVYKFTLKYATYPGSFQEIRWHQALDQLVQFFYLIILTLQAGRLLWHLLILLNTAILNGWSILRRFFLVGSFSFCQNDLSLFLLPEAHNKFFSFLHWISKSC